MSDAGVQVTVRGYRKDTSACETIDSFAMGP